MQQPSAADVIEALTDPGSWSSWDAPPRLPPEATEDAYAAQRRRAAQRSGVEESVLTGAARVAGMQVAIIAQEFGFLAGSVGHDAPDRVIRAHERATKLRLPIVAAPVSGGTRMQEGTPAFLRMAGIAAAAADHRAAGLPSLVLLRGPTTGGVLASWGSLGQVTLSEPGALVGFLGPRVYREVMGEPFPTGVQTAENLAAHGVIDAVLEPSRWRGAATRFLAIAAARPGEPPHWAANPGPVPEPVAAAATSVTATAPYPDPDAWGHVLQTRRADRPGADAWLQRCATDVLPLAGTAAGERADGLLLVLARLRGRGVVIVAQDRTAQSSGALIGPWSLRAARRGMRLAAELGLPLVTLIDTPGAALSPAAEEGAMAGEIARCLADLSQLPVPSVAVVLGQGAGGGAIALLPCDRVVAAENAWVTPLPPEGAAAIVHRDAGRAAQMAAEQRITAAALAGIGAVDAIVPETGDWLPVLGDAVVAQLQGLDGAVVEEGGRVRLAASQLRRRRDRWRGIDR